MHKSKMIAEWYAEKSKMWNTFYDTRRIKYTDIPYISVSIHENLNLHQHPRGLFLEII